MSFPSNIATVPIEQFENSVPILVTEKELIPDSGGAGRYRGGPAQRLSFKSTSDQPITMTIRHERVDHPPRGLLGGLAGSPGRDYLNGERIPAKGRLDINLGDVVTFETPGGGGMGPPEGRAAEKIAADIQSGLVTQEAADTIYSHGELKAKKYG